MSLCSILPRFGAYMKFRKKSFPAVFTIQFTEDDYSYVEGDPNARVCLEGVGDIAAPATATVSSLPRGTATGGPAIS